MPDILRYVLEVPPGSPLRYEATLVSANGHYLVFVRPCSSDPVLYLQSDPTESVEGWDAIHTTLEQMRKGVYVPG